MMAWKLKRNELVCALFLMFAVFVVFSNHKTAEAANAKGKVTFGQSYQEVYPYNSTPSLASGDVWTIELPSAGTLNVNYITSIKDSTDKWKLTWSLHDCNDKCIDSETRIGPPAENSLVFNLNAGVYYFYIYPTYNMYEEKIYMYNFYANFTSAEKTYTYSNNSLGEITTQSAIELNKDINGFFTSYDDKLEWYKIQIDKKQIIEVSVNNTSNDSLKVSLYTPDLVVYNDDDNNSEKSVAVNNVGVLKYTLDPGTYYVKFQGYGSGKFTFRVSQLGTVAETDDSNKLGKVTIKSVKNNKKGSVLIKWYDVDGADGYDIQYSLKKSFSGKKTKKSSYSMVNIKKLKKKKTYYIRVRAFVITDEGKVYGSWSKVKTVKIKK
ncbi:MAG: hypothetical protein K6F77_01150 [Lachnospiraceae bacterium]|nr:hypothetical protein [Lachnospiraceae bacterium]